VAARRSSSPSRPPGRPGRLPVADGVADRADRLLAVAEHRDVDELRDRLRVERRVAAGDDDRVGLVAVGRRQRNARPGRAP
jgi:hypothetical protein